MSGEEMKELMQALDEHLTVNDDEGRPVLHVSLLATVYFEDPHRREVRKALVSCIENYFRHHGEHLRWALDPATEQMERFGAGKGSDPRAWLPMLGEDESFSLIYHGAEHDRGASGFSLKVLGMERRPYTQLGYLRVSFPLLRFVQGSGSLPEELLEICRVLRPISGYGGIGVIESPDGTISSKYEPLVFQWAQRFPGLEADYTTSHSIWLRKGRGGKPGIKGVNWLTVVGDTFVEEMGGAEKIEADLASLDRRFVVHHSSGGILIQAGDHPELGVAERDLWPELYVKLSQYLKPIRITEHRPFQHGGPGERFDKARSEAWLRRFDDR